MTRKTISSAQARGGAAQQRAEGEQENAEKEKTFSPEQIRKPSADGKNDGVGDQIGREHPGALIVAGAQVARDVRQRDIGDAGVEHFHERGHGDHHGDQPGIELRLPWRSAVAGAVSVVSVSLGHRFVFRRLLDVNLGIDRHAGTQAVIVVLAGLEIDADWNALHHLHVVSGRILRRQQAESRTAGAADRLHSAAVFAAVRVHAELDPLARFHALKLRLLEVGGHPDVVERNHRHELLARRNVLTDLHGLLADDPANRSDDGAVAEIESRLIERRSHLRDLRLRGLGTRLADRDLLRRRHRRLV